MDSINALKGYNKVGEDNNNDNDPSIRKARTRLIISIASLALLTTLIIASIIYTSISDKSEDARETTTSTSSDQTLQSLCNATQHPNSCLSTLSPLKSSDPVHLFSLSLQVSMAELQRVASAPKNMLGKVNGKGVEAALRDCEGLIGDAIDAVNKSIECVGLWGKQGLGESTVNDVRTWLSAALTDQETCLEGLEETGGSGVGGEMKAAMKDSAEFVSNSLAIATKIGEIGRSVQPGSHHRKLLGISVN